MTANERKLLSSEMIYSGKIINLRVDTITLPDGRHATREVVEHKGAVAIVPVNGQGEVILVRQPRHATGETLLEIPAGKLEEGEVPTVCARRELQEETGFVADSIEKLFSCYSTPGFTNEYLHIYLATGLTYTAENPDYDEDIEIISKPLSEAIELIWNGGIRDAKSICGILAAATRLK